MIFERRPAFVRKTDMLDEIVSKAPLFLLVSARCAALLFTLPLFSMRTVPKAAKIALAGYMAFFLMGSADYSVYGAVLSVEDGAFSLYYIMLLAGEALIGVIIGFFVSMIFAAFSTAGQFFAFQMGFSAASAYDALSQVENPLMGQYLNLIAMLVFMQTQWFQKLFLKGLAGSLTSLNVFELVSGRERLVSFLLKGLSNLFADALLIALPIMGTLLLITVCTGLLSKAAPQMNLLSEGFPIMILLAFLIIWLLFPLLCDFFIESFSTGIDELMQVISDIGGGSQ
ncbi:flagellar biosynthetic protein FliR [Treponema porcinum]|uniref:flagellar biosynthetic protein FliR n=2 Tax=Treponemataceae TaxID=2845253 RepID=UPI0023549E2B|nr:flagellar biosynthetic protein FliR [Treponema porcinum]MCI5645758.1 flagellar biosynthetic protein FliR [Treponema porcinum]MDY4467920.1 flagellar biosynthetic protein FliR [Treponema porcinum]